jgi:hypothetical protein
VGGLDMMFPEVAFMRSNTLCAVQFLIVTLLRNRRSNATVFTTAFNVAVVGVTIPMAAGHVMATVPDVIVPAYPSSDTL